MCKHPRSRFLESARLVTRPNPSFSVFFKPLLASALMAAAAKAVLFAAQNLLHLPSVICIALTVGVAVIVYAVLVISLRTLTKDDVMLLPKGEKVAKFLKIQ